MSEMGLMSVLWGVVQLFKALGALVGTAVARWSRWTQTTQVGRLVTWVLIGLLVVGVLAGVILARYVVGWYTFAELGATLVVLVLVSTAVFWDVEDLDEREHRG